MYHTLNQSCISGHQRTCPYQMVVHCLVVGISLSERVSKLSTQSLAQAVPLLSLSLSYKVLYTGKVRHRSFCDISGLVTLSLEHVWSSVVAFSSPVLPTCGGHSLVTLEHALITVLQTTAVGSNARNLPKLLFPFLTCSDCAEKQQSSHRSLFAKVQKQILICRYATLGCRLACIILSCDHLLRLCHCGNAVLTLPMCVSQKR